MLGDADAYRTMGPAGGCEAFRKRALGGGLRVLRMRRSRKVVDPSPWPANVLGSAMKSEVGGGNRYCRHPEGSVVGVNNWLNLSEAW